MGVIGYVLLVSPNTKLNSNTIWQCSTHLLCVLFGGSQPPIWSAMESPQKRYRTSPVEFDMPMFSPEQEIRMRAASASAIQSAAVKECDLQSIESMCSYLAETFLEEELEEERIAGDDDSVASCSDTEGSTAWLSKDLSMQSSDQEDTTVSDCTVEPPDYSKLDATIIVDSDISPPLNQSVGHRDDEARDLVVANLLETILNNKSGKGAKTKEQQERLDVLAMAMMSEEIRARRLQSAVTRVFGMSRAQQDRGLTLLEMQAKVPCQCQMG